MNLHNLFAKTKKQSTFNWCELSEDLSIAQKMNIAENYFINNKLLESDDHAIKYFTNLTSDSPKKNHKYVVVPLLLIQNNVHTLNTELLYLTYLKKTNEGLVFANDKGKNKTYPETKTTKGIYRTFAFSNNNSYNDFRSKLSLKFNIDLPPADNIFKQDVKEGTIDDLEARRIEDLNAKMDDLTARAKDTSDPKFKEALRHEFARAKAERDSYYKINVDEAPGAETLAHNQATDASNIQALGLAENDLEEHGGGGGVPREWHNFVKAHRTNEEIDTNYTYTVFIDGTKEGTYGSKEEAKAVVARKKQQAPGRDYTIRPKSRTNMASIKRFQKNRDREIEEAANPAQQAAIAINMKKHHQKPKTETSMAGASHKSTGPKFSGYLKGTDPAPTEYSNKSFGSEAKENPMGEKELAYLIAMAKAAHSKSYPELHQGDEREINGDDLEVEEGINGNMTVRSSPLSQPLRKRNFVAKNAIQSGAGKHANQLKKAAAAGRHAKHKGQPLDLDEGDNFLTWAVRNGYNLNKPAVYESAKQKYNSLLKDSGPIAPHETYYGAMDESLKKGEYFIWTVYFDDGSSKRIKVTSDEFDPYEYYAKQKKNVINVDYNWEIQQ